MNQFSQNKGSRVEQHILPDGPNLNKAATDTTDLPEVSDQFQISNRPLQRFLMACMTRNTNLPQAEKSTIDRNTFFCARSVLINALTSSIDPNQKDERIQKIMEAARLNLAILDEFGQPAMQWQSKKKAVVSQLECTSNPVLYDSSPQQHIAQMCNFILSEYLKCPSPNFSLVYAIERDNPEFNVALTQIDSDLEKDISQLIYLVFLPPSNNAKTLTYELVRDEGLELIETGRMEDAISSFWSDSFATFSRWNDTRAKAFRNQTERLRETHKPTQLELWQLFRNIFQNRTDSFASDLVYHFDKVSEGIEEIRVMDPNLLSLSEGDK